MVLCMMYNCGVMKPEEKIIQLGFRLPDAPKPVAAYVAVKRFRSAVITAGQLPMVEGKAVFAGKLGENISIEQGAEAAKIALLNALAAIKSEIGELGKIKQIVRLNGFVASAAGFTGQAKVMNGASQLLTEIFGEKGKHTRIAVGVAELPMGVPVELDLMVEV
jgi:enamine deaminase RidA (YjgF/YER057c/UK114 family)